LPVVAVLEKFLDLILPKTPPWLIVPVAIIVLFLFAWPTLRDIFTESLPSYRKYAREKQRLELLKLYYETEGIRKDHQLDEAVPTGSDDLMSLIRRPVLQVATDKSGGNQDGLPSARRFAFGCIGGFAVFFISVLNLSVTIEDASSGFFLGLALKGILLALLGGGFAWLSNARTPASAIVFGAIAPFVISLLLAQIGSGVRFPAR
jgi:hypothetical protein